MSGRSLPRLFAATLALVGPSSASAHGTDELPEDYLQEPSGPPPASHYRNPQGSVLFQGYAGLSTGGGRTTYVLGVGFGYAVVTGVVPGVRGLVLGGDGVGGEAAATLTLTPPLELSVTPFVLGEAGRRWVPGIDGWLFGAGAGLYLGDPASAVNLQLGWIFRTLRFDGGGSFDLSGPLISISVRFG